MKVVATPKLGTYAAFSGLALLAALLLRRPEPLVLAAPFLLLLVLGLSTAHRPVVSVKHQLSRDRILEGESTALELTISVTTVIERLELLPQLPLGLEAAEPARIVGLHLDAGEAHRLRYLVQGRRWGGYTLGDLLLRSRDHWGLLVYEGRSAAKLPVRVYPRLEALRVAPRPADTQALSGNTLARQSGEGIEFAGLREFVRGDQIRRVNWRASARSDHLMVNEQHPERNADIIIFLDTFYDPGDAVSGILDLAVHAAATLAEHYLRDRDRVGLISFGGALRWLIPAAGSTQRYRIIEALINTQLVLSYAWKGLDIIPPRTLPPQAFVLALTPLLDERTTTALLNLAARGFDLAIIEISPLPFVDLEDSPEGRLALRLWPLRRDIQRYRYQQSGVPTAVWRAGEPLASTLEEVRSFQRFARRRRV